jgi:transposase-like protein
MSPRKLTESDKKDILRFYRQSQATTSTLAERYGVSSSTISRFLKNNLSHSEYENLIQQKRLAHSSKRDSQASQPAEEQLELTPILENSEEIPSYTNKVSSIDEPEDLLNEDIENSLTRRRRKRISAPSKVIEEFPQPEEFQPQEEVEAISLPQDSSLPQDTNLLSKKEFEELETITLGEMLGEDIADLDDDDLDEEDDDLDDEDWGRETPRQLTYPHAVSNNLRIKILPLSTASFPKTCYLVVDRSAELITRPLEDFADLGTIPQGEVEQRTLPVFDNHRVAKRFSHRRERVIKIPDGYMLKKTSHYLQAKGITRLLMDGQVYSLSQES